MGRHALRRLGASLALLWIVLTATFFVIHLAPGEPAALFADPRISAASRELLRHHYGLDRPLPVQYGRWLRAVVSGDWGMSLTFDRPAAAVLAQRLPATVLLALGATLVEYGLGVPLAVAAAARPHRWRDRTIRLVALLLYAVPVFWMAIVAIELFAVRWPLFPAQHMSSRGAAALPWAERVLDLGRHLVMPALVLGLARCGGVVRYLRGSLLDVLGQDYIQAARARGLPERRILWLHAMRNALGPLVQRFGLGLPVLLSGALIIEVIFSWPGIGLTTYRAILERDYPLILAGTALSGVFVVLGTLSADLLQAALDPRVRRPARG